MPAQTPPSTPQILIEDRGPGEWIVAAPGGTRSLHVYRLAPTDWLVSEVGVGNEGRGDSLAGALAALSGGPPFPDWWELVTSALGAR